MGMGDVAGAHNGVSKSEYIQAHTPKPAAKTPVSESSKAKTHLSTSKQDKVSQPAKAKTPKEEFSDVYKQFTNEDINWGSYEDVLVFKGTKKITGLDYNFQSFVLAAAGFVSGEGLAYIFAGTASTIAGACNAGAGWLAGTTWLSDYPSVGSYTSYQIILSNSKYVTRYQYVNSYTPMKEEVKLCHYGYSYEFLVGNGNIYCTYSQSFDEALLYTNTRWCN